MNTKVLFVINVDWYFRLHWLERAEYFKSQGYEVHVATTFTKPDIERELTEKGFFCHRIQIKRKSINIIREFISFVKVFRLLRTLSPDLIHCITIKPNVYVGLLNGIFFKRPIVYSVTGLGVVFSSRKFKFLVLRKLTTYLYRLVSTPNSRFIFENSEDYHLFEHASILKYRNGIVIKGAGINLNRFTANQPPLNRQVLFASRLLEEKGLRVLLEAKDILSTRNFDFTLNVAGIIDNDASSAIPLEQIEQWAKEGSIEWLGNVTDMPDLIKCNDIVCLPTSYGEGIPRILIEAASCQRAIITTSVPGCREIVTDGVNGFLVEPKDALSLADCIQELIENENMLVNFGLNGRRIAVEEFSQELVFEKTQSVYSELLIL